MKILLFILSISIITFGCSLKNKSVSDSSKILVSNIEDVDPSSIIKTIRKKAPLTFALNKANDKIFLLEKKENGFDESLHFIVIEKINNSWVEINNYKIADTFEKVLPINDSIQNILIDNKNYIFFALECNQSGSAYNGFNANTFVYYDDFRDSLIEVTYSIWVGDASGNYSIKNSSLKNYTSILKHTAMQVENIYGKQNLNINDPNNFHLKWLAMNNDIYDKAEKYSDLDIWFDFNALLMSKDFFFSRIEDDPNRVEVKSNSKYMAYGGFVNPVLVYSKEKSITYVLWIPAGWPAGGAWGIRSFMIDDIKEDIIIASDKSQILHFDINNMKVKSIKKS
jgi:hypothetical protein